MQLIEIVFAMISVFIFIVGNCVGFFLAAVLRRARQSSSVGSMLLQGLGFILFGLFAPSYYLVWTFPHSELVAALPDNIYTFVSYVVPITVLISIAAIVIFIPRRSDADSYFSYLRQAKEKTARQSEGLSEQLAQVERALTDFMEKTA